MINAVPNENEAAYRRSTCSLGATRQHLEMRPGFCEGSFIFMDYSINHRNSVLCCSNIRTKILLFAIDNLSVTVYCASGDSRRFFRPLIPLFSSLYFQWKFFRKNLLILLLLLKNAATNQTYNPHIWCVAFFRMEVIERESQFLQQFTKNAMMVCRSDSETLTLSLGLMEMYSSLQRQLCSDMTTEYHLNVVSHSYEFTGSPLLPWRQRATLNHWRTHKKVFKTAKKFLAGFIDFSISKAAKFKLCFIKST
jgi:hypothetical protein